MAVDFINWVKLDLLSQIDSDISLDDKAHKLGEEYGEFLQSLLKYKGSKNVSASVDEDTKEHLLEELCDVINVSIDIINSLGFSNEESMNMFDKKLNKWKMKAIKYSDKKDLIDRLQEIDED